MKHNYKNLRIWKDSIEMAKCIYDITEAYPDKERYGLSSQMRRASISVTSNIAEGSSRTTDKHFKQFLSIAIGSIYELQSQLIISLHLNYLSKDQYKIIENELTILNKRMHAFSNKTLS